MKNKIYNKIKLGSALFASLAVMASCTSNFEDMNRNPGEPTYPEFKPYLKKAVMQQMIDNVYSSQENSYQMNENLIGDPYGRYLSIANSGFVANFSIFNASDSWVNYPFNDIMEKFYTNYKIFQDASTEEDAHLLAWAQILRVASMHRLADMYGPIPYSKVGSGGIAAGYDSQEMAYKTMIEDLTNSVKVLDKFVSEHPTTTVLPGSDNVFNSDMRKWMRFANSLKLRLAMRMAYADPAAAKTAAEEAIKAPNGVLENTGDLVSEFSRDNPVWKMCTNWGDSRVAADIVTYMQGYKDPRLEFYFTKGTVGLTEKEAEDPAKHYFIGLRTGVELPEKKDTGKYSSVTFQQTDRTIWMTPAEITLLRAEGALRGWDMGGSAKDLYERGIQLSFDQWNAGDATTYLNDATSTQADYTNPVLTKQAIKAVSTATVKWNEASNFETKLEKIITQKWIAMFPLGTEAWSEQRRTGYPKFFPTMQNASSEAGLETKLASRIPFPPSEKEKNEANYNEAIKLLGGADKYGTKVWWDQNPNK